MLSLVSTNCDAAISADCLKPSTPDARLLPERLSNWQGSLFCHLGIALVTDVRSGSFQRVCALPSGSSANLSSKSLLRAFWGAGETHPGAALQDILRLLTLWFNHGSAPDVEAALQEGFGHVSIDTWLVVIPQVPLSSLMLHAAMQRCAVLLCYGCAVLRCAVLCCADMLWPA